jgi:hypothetical protein
MFGMLQQAVHHIWMAYGVSRKTYRGGNIKGINMPMHGIGQGNGAGPAIWAVISCLILEVMHKQGYIATFVLAISWMSIALCGFLFMDDADLLFMAQTTHQQGKEIAESAQRHLDEWEGLIHATGGAIIPSKSFWYLMDFQWNGTDWIYQDTADKLSFLISLIFSYLLGMSKSEPELVHEDAPHFALCDRTFVRTVLFRAIICHHEALAGAYCPSLSSPFHDNL